MIAVLLPGAPLAALALLVACMSTMAHEEGEGPIDFHAALSHSAYTKSAPQSLLLKVDYAVTTSTQTERPPLNIALVLDRSASMAEARKFPYTIEAAREVIENMGDRDILAIIAFNEKVTVLSPAGRVVNKQFLYHRLTEISPAGYTDISAGLLEGIAQLESQKAEEQVRHVFVLTDGMANRGVTDPAGIQKMCEKAHARGIGVSTFGCGTEFNEKRLTEMAQVGGGRYTYVKSPEQIPTAFVEELHGLLQAAAQNAVIEVGVTDGQISKIYGQPVDQLARSFKFDIGNLRAGERGIFLIEIQPSRFEAGASVTAEVRLTFDDPQAGERVKRAISANSAFTVTGESTALDENEGIVLYGEILRALETTEEAAKGLDAKRARQAHVDFDKLYEQARQQAIQNKDQDLLNQTFLLKHFMEELAAAENEGLLHDHSQARKKISKESDYQRYLLMHHRLHSSEP